MADTVSVPHSITLEQRKRLSMAGIEAVESFNDKLVQIRVSEGVLLAVKGSALNVSKFNTENGTLSVEGVIEELKYTDKGQGGLIKKMFK